MLGTLILHIKVNGCATRSRM